MQHNRPKWLELVNHPDFVALYNTWPGNEVALRYTQLMNLHRANVAKLKQK